MQSIDFHLAVLSSKNSKLSMTQGRDKGRVIFFFFSLILLCKAKRTQTLVLV